MIQRLRTGYLAVIITGLLMFSAIVAAVPQPGWVELGTSTERVPTRELVSDRDGSTVIDITIPGLEIGHRVHQGISYQQVSLPYGGIIHEVGKPCLPLVTELVAIPDQGEVQVRVLDIQTTTIPDVNVYPFLEPPHRDGKYSEPELVFDEEIYQSRKPFPLDWVRVLSPVIWRDLRLTPVVVQPVRWNPETKELTVATNLRIAVETTGTGGTSVKDRRSSTVSSRYATMYADRVINWNSSGLDLSGEGSLLIITRTLKLLPQALRGWEHLHGFVIP